MTGSVAAIYSQSKHCQPKRWGLKRNTPKVSSIRWSKVSSKPEITAMSFRKPLEEVVL
jgi:hypothetical protein